MHRRTLLSATCAALATPTLLRAQPKPLTIVVGFNPGGPVDIVARQLAERLREPLGRQVLVDYKPGAGGQFAFTALKQAPADGALVVLSPPSPLTIFPSTFSKLPYEAARDFAPVATACSFDFAFVVGAQHPAQTLAEFVAWAKANPRQANLGIAGLGSTPHFLGWTFAQAAGITLEPVPYKGTPQMAQEVAAGQLACALSPQANFAELIKGGKLRLLGTTGAQRSSVFPQVPTFAEQGFASLQSEEWFGFFMRAGTAQPLLDGFAEALRKVVAQEGVRKALVELGFIPEVRDAARLARDIRSDFERWAEVVRRTGFKADA